MDIKNNDLVTTGNTVITPLTVIDDPTYAIADNYGGIGRLCNITYLIEIISGTVKFGIGGVGANSNANAVGAKLIFKCKNGQLYCKQTSAGDTFRVTTAA